MKRSVLFLAAVLGLTATLWSAPSENVLQALQRNGDPAQIGEEYHWDALPPATRQAALKLMDGWLNTHPSQLQEVLPHGWPRLQLAAYRGQVEIVHMLLDRGASMEADLGPPVGRISALQTALGLVPAPLQEAAHPTPELVTLLLDRGAGVNEPVPSNGSTPLSGAVRSVALTKVLLDHGADVNAADKLGRTPLFEASTPAVAMLLESHGARFAVTDKQGETPYQAAALAVEPNPLLVDWYLSHGIQPDVWTMAALGRTDKVRELVSQNPSLVNAVGPDGEGPLGWAISNGHVDTVLLLLQRGASPNRPDGQGETAMHRAARSRYIELIPMLAAHGANVNASNRDGDTPLLVAVARRPANAAMIGALLKAGANVNAQGNVGQTPLSLCRGNAALEALLRAHGAH